jgi:UDP-N-acetylglucosamine:LPS N-acetylglucosamine transferase
MKRIVFAMIEAGGGHKAPARAVMEALQAAYPGRYQATMMDFIKDIGCENIDASHKKSWTLLLGQPLLTHLLYQLEDILGPISRAVLYRTLAAPAVPNAIRFLKRVRPDAVFSTHFLNSMILVEARKRSKIDFEIFTYQTEMFSFHALWRVPETDWYLTASDRAAQAAAIRGIKWNKIKSFPYPIRPDFLASRRDPALVSRELGLLPGRKTVLFSFGNQGAGMVIQYILTMELMNTPLNVVIVAGRNAALKRRLEALKERFPRVNLIPLGYVDNMNELISIADVCYIKPGPATTMECMHSRKPIIFSNAATPCEQAHANYAVFRGVAKYAGDAIALFATALKHFLKDEVQAEVSRRYETLDIKNGASEIAAFIDETLTKKTETRNS